MRKQQASTIGAIEHAIASTASNAVRAAKGTGRRIRKIAKRVLAHDERVSATDLLIAQHRSVEDLFAELEKSGGRPSQTVRKLADALAGHMTIEERIFYPAIRALNPSLILEGLEEHAMGRFALERLVHTKPADEAFRARTKALKELMVNHQREEERELFPKAKKAMPKEAALELGEKMKRLFDATVQLGYQAAIAGQVRVDAKRRGPSEKPTVPAKPRRAKNARAQPH